MSRRKTKPEEVRNPEHYFNRMMALEHQRDEQDTAEYMKRFPSLDAMIEGGSEGPCHNSVMLMAVNENGEEFDRYISGSSFFGWIEVIENQTLFKAVKSLSDFEKTILTYRYLRGISQRQTAEVMGVPQTTISYTERRIKKTIRDFFKKVAQNC